MDTDTALHRSLTRFAITTCVVALTPLAAYAQSGILHKRTYAPGASLAATASPLSAVAGSVSSLPAAADPKAVPPGGPVGPGQGWGDAVSGIVVDVPGVVDGAPTCVPGCAPAFPGHDAAGFDGGAVVTLPAGVDVVGGGEVHIMPYPFTPGGELTVKPMPGAIVTMPAPADGVPGVAHGHAMGAGPTFRPHGRAGLKGGASVSLPVAAEGSNGVQVVSFAAMPTGGRPESAAAAMGDMTRAAQPGGRFLSQPPANGLHKHALGVHASGNAAPAAETAASPKSAVARGGVMAGVKPVAVERSAAPLRWVDRLRFSWPGSGN